MAILEQKIMLWFDGHIWDQLHLKPPYVAIIRESLLRLREW
jgi:hypothetical protein